MIGCHTETTTCVVAKPLVLDIRLQLLTLLWIILIVHMYIHHIIKTFYLIIHIGHNFLIYNVNLTKSRAY